MWLTPWVVADGLLQAGEGRDAASPAGAEVPASRMACSPWLQLIWGDYLLPVPCQMLQGLPRWAYSVTVTHLPLNGRSTGLGLPNTCLEASMARIQHRARTPLDVPPGPQWMAWPSQH